MPETTINVVFIDTQEMFRDGVKKSFSKFPDIKIVFEAENEKKLMSQVGLDQIDVILIGVDKLSQ
jgi:DNA-binding NarL/FixJ family response regulator